MGGIEAGTEVVPSTLVVATGAVELAGAVDWYTGAVELAIGGILLEPQSKPTLWTPMLQSG